MLKEKQRANEELYRGGKGWLPAPLDDIGTSKDSVHPERAHSSIRRLELFRSASEGSMNQIRFSSWARVRPDPKDRTTVVAKFSNDEPFLLEKPYKKGRVVLSTVPMDRGWNSTLPGAWEFPILAHELAYYLAGIRSESARLQHGEPIRLVIDKDSPRITLQTPDINTKMIDVESEKLDLRQHRRDRRLPGANAKTKLGVRVRARPA